MIDALSHTTWFVRDVAGRLQYQTNANNEVLQFSYNAADELLALTDGKNQVTHWNYDEFGRVTNKVDQANAEILRYTYDPDGRLTNRWSAAKGNTKYKYDSVGNLTNIDYPVSTDVSYAYDPLNRLTNMIDAVGTNIFTYSGSGQLVTEDGPFASDTISSIYWNRMRTNLSLVQPTGVWINAFGYDNANRLNGVSSPAGTFTYTYDEPSTRLTGLTLPSGAYVVNQFDTMSRLTNTYLYSSVPAALDGHVYQYDRENQRTNEVRGDSSTVAYKYDKIGQLIVADSSVASEDRGYTYDTAWNLNFRTNNGSLSTFIVDNKNELTNALSNPNTYDQNGNLADADNSHDIYEYDDENQLIQWFHFQNGVSSPTTGDKRTDFIYDGKMRLRKRLEYILNCPGGIDETGPQPGGGEELSSPSVGNCLWSVPNETWYIYDGARVVQERNGNNTPTVSYTRGNDLSVSLEGAGGIGGLLARSIYSGGNWTNHADYYADGNGNITSLIDTNQSIVASYRYDPFGNIISKSGSLADANVYRFSSKEVHVNSGMCYYGFRFYEPNLQRWVNRDPIGERGGVNLYAYVQNDPSDHFDFFGLDGQVIVNSNCQGKDLSKWTYLAEAEPPSAEDRKAGRAEGKKLLRQLPDPGQAVAADAIYYPGGATKISDVGVATVDCASGSPKLDYSSIVPFGIHGDGAEWKSGDLKAPDRWPDSTIPPYQNEPPGPVAPPLNPHSQVPIPDLGSGTPGRRS
jgi:RHS repeat-associated protein